MLPSSAMLRGAVGYRGLLALRTACISGAVGAGATICTRAVSPAATASKMLQQLPPQVSVRAFSAPAGIHKTARMDAHVYHRLVDNALDDLSGQLEELVEKEDLDGREEQRGSGKSATDWDIEYATGMINANFGSFGTYVINKQPPSQQVWLSSPASGPKRFDYDADHRVWFTYKDDQLYLLHELLNAELSDIFGIPVRVDLGGTAGHV